MTKGVFISPERARLGRELKILRLASLLLLSDVSPKIGVAAGTVSRMESGQIPVRAAYLAVMLDLYGVDDPAERKRLADLAREGMRPPGWRKEAAAGRGTLRHRIDAACPLMCIDGLIPAKVFVPVRDYLRAEAGIAHPTVADFAELYQQTGLAGICDLSPSARNEVRRFMKRSPLAQDQ